MSHAELVTKVQDVFRSVFEDDALSIARETTAADVPGWDSFAHVNLIVAIEAAFDISFSLNEVQDLECVGDMIDVLDRKVGAQ